MQNAATIKQDYGKEYSISLTINGEETVLNNNDIYEFYVIEDLYSFMLTGSLTFNDRNNLFEFSHITGDIQIKIWFGVNETMKITLNVFRSTRLIPSGPNEQGSKNTIQLSLAQFEFRYLTSQKYSYSWSNIKITDIISDIIENMLKFKNNNTFENKKYYVMEDSEEKLNFVMPYWTPFQALNWLLLRASSNNKWGYCCYTSILDHRLTQTDEYTIMYIQTLESMLKQTRLAPDVNDGIYKISSPGLYDFAKILTYDISGIDMSSTKQIRGGHVLGYDFNRKKVLDEEFQYSKGNSEDKGFPVADNFTMLGDWTLMVGTEHSYLNDTEVNLQMSGESDENIISNIYLNDWIKRYCVQNMISITVRGHETRKLGSLIWLDWPSSSKDEVYNANLNGLYLVKSITHYFDPKGSPTYRQKMGLIKNAYNYDSLTKEYSYPSKKKNDLNVSNLMEN